MKFLYPLERKLGKYAVRNLMLIITVGQLAVFVISFLFPSLNLIGWMSLSRAAVLQGQIWRLVTFILIPPNTSILFILISLYFYYMIGGALENEWGAFMFNVYYFIGIIGAIAAAFITGVGDNYYLNMSLFLAFAILYPDFEVLLFYILPIKMKYLAILDAALFLISFIRGPWSARAAIIASLVNLIIFFGGTFVNYVKQQQKYAKTRRNFRSQTETWNKNSNRFR
ncbi:MAG: hypothetical protein RR998_01490 [Oscillospiraceae bacterium]